LSNETGESALYDFSYYVNHGLIDKNKLQYLLYNTGCSHQDHLEEQKDLKNGFDWYIQKFNNNDDADSLAIYKTLKNGKLWSLRQIKDDFYTFFTNYLEQTKYEQDRGYTILKTKTRSLLKPIQAMKVNAPTPDSSIFKYFTEYADELESAINAVIGYNIFNSSTITDFKNAVLTLQNTIKDVFTDLIKIAEYQHAVRFTEMFGADVVEFYPTDISNQFDSDGKQRWNCQNFYNRLKGLNSKILNNDNLIREIELNLISFEGKLKEKQYNLQNAQQNCLDLQQDFCDITDLPFPDFSDTDALKAEVTYDGKL
jgi:hypothetical protein